MKPMSHGRKGLLWVGVAAALWLMAAPQKAPAESADEVPAGPTKLLRIFPGIESSSFMGATYGLPRAKAARRAG